MIYRIGIDVGGTFTDCVLVRPNGSLQLTKAATTPQDQSQGVIAGIEQLARAEAIGLRELLAATSVIVHGTTTADNTMIEMNGAVTGLITSAGHRDEIELRRGFKEDIWDPAIAPPPPIAPRRRRIGVPERLDFEGNVVVPLDEEAVRAALQRLRKLGCESLAVVFLFSFINPAHEKRVGEIAAEEFPDLSVSLSHEVMPSAPEFERTSTTLVNAYVGPRVNRYLKRLIERLRSDGYRGQLLIMQSNGGIMRPEYIEKRPVAVLSSGPTGGVIAACNVAAAAKVEDFVCGDMGGTSYDVCLIRAGRPEIKAGWNWHHRYVIGLPMVDVHSIGAGGGSIASVVAGTLQVGPRSAGAEPGPVCYGRGGDAPTVTDANAVLGYLNPRDFCDGTMELRLEDARVAIEESIARPLGLGVAEAASGIYRLVNANMANAIRKMSAQRGADPRELTMVVYGGNGPVHATAQAAELGIKSVLVPKTSPAFSALGLLLSDHLLDEMRAYITPVGRADLGMINQFFDEMTHAARKMLSSRSGLWSRVEIRRYAHLCYPGQTFDIAVPVVVHALARHEAPASRDDWEATIERFHDLHEELHTYASREEEPILRAVRITAVGIVDKPRLPRVSRSSGRPHVKERRKAFFEGKFVLTRVFDGPRLRAGHRVKGPAIIEEPFTTIMLHPRQTAVLDRNGNYHIEIATG
jgi:N-methylhydantoinase A